MLIYGYNHSIFARNVKQEIQNSNILEEFHIHCSWTSPYNSYDCDELNQVLSLNPLAQPLTTEVK